MALKLTINNGSGDVNYSNYVDWTSLKIDDSINVPTIVDFDLFNKDSSFVVPVPGAYFKIVSTKFNTILATGFITNTPEVTPLGVGMDSSAVQRFFIQKYSCVGTDDSWLLNVKATPFVPAFINQTMGAILANLAQTLAPGFINTTTFVASGDLVPFYQYDPAQTWADIAKDFGDSVRYRWKIINKILYFVPFGDQPLGISFNDSTLTGKYDPYSLTTSLITVPPVNDCIVLGDTEPQQNWDDYFIGDGFTGNFPLTHQVFEGGNANLLEDDWTENSLQTNVWNSSDPQGAFSLPGLLNLVGGTGVFGQTWLLGVNGLELGGQVNVQTGECLFVDNTTAVLGGLYSAGPDINNTLKASGLIAGFYASASGGTTVFASASGAIGMTVQPCIFSGGFSGSLIPGILPVGPKIVTNINHHYQLQMIVSAQRVTRYNRVYRTLAGSQFGGQQIAASGSITWIITDIDLSQVFLQPLSGAQYPVPRRTVILQYTQAFLLPSFALYSPINAASGNMALAYTILSIPPMGSLVCQSLYGPTGGFLPVLPQNLGAPTQYSLGIGFGNQVASLVTGSTSAGTDTLTFYDDTIPAVGARIRLQSWAAGTSVGRVQDPANIALAAVTAGDDGVRKAIMTNLKPLPRSSEECELAAQAAILDRENPQYQGSYNVSSYFWASGNQVQVFDYPRSGRYFNVNSLARNILNQNFFCTRSVITVLEAFSEWLQFEVDFGQDLYLEKTLENFLQRDIPELLPQQTLNTPSPQTLAQVGLTYLPNLDAAQCTSIDSNFAFVDLGVTPTSGCEVRLSDNGWGTTNSLGLVGRFTTRTFQLPRTQFNQTFYMRMVNGTQTSRFSKILRISYPLIPAPPLLLSIEASNVDSPEFDFIWNGDLRNIYGIEIRDSDNQTVLMQQTVATAIDMVFFYQNAVKNNRNITIYAYFFNLMWGYSAPTIVNLSLPAPIVVPSVDNVGGNLVLTVVPAPSGGQPNLIQFFVASTSGYAPISASGAVSGNSASGAVVTFTVGLNNPDLLQPRFIKARGIDSIGPGPFIQIFHIYTAQGVVEFLSGIEADNIAAPPTPNTDPPVVGILQPYKQLIVNESWINYTKQIGRNQL